MIERYKSSSLIPSPMRIPWFVVFVIALLVLGGCQKKNVITGRAIEGAGPVAEVPAKVQVPESADTVSDSAEDDEPSAIQDEPKEPEQFADVTEVPTYDIKSQCTKDTKGVVRYFDDAGKKTVYRNDCVANLLVTYDCDANQVISKNEQCEKGCKQGAYGDTCA